jgi:predicted DNA-binding transcriptional regulator YafY
VRASRLISILLLLQIREQMTARQLADALEVSVRTVYRDMESLSAAGVPVYGEPGHDGGYRILGGFRTRLTGLTSEEAKSLFLTGSPSAADELGLGAVTGAQLKLMAALPADLRDRARRIAGRLHLDAPAWYHDAGHTPYLRVLADAVFDDRAVWMRYLRWAQPREITRTMYPFGLVLKAGHWYLVADAAGQTRTYRISRIVDLHVLDEQFDRPAGFNLASYWKAYLEHFDARRHQGSAILRLSPDALGWLPHLMEPAIAQAAEKAAAAVPADQDGWIQVTIPIESVDQALRELLRFGAEAEILAPAELRDQMTRTAKALNRIYNRQGA